MTAVHAQRRVRAAHRLGHLCCGMLLGAAALTGAGQALAQTPSAAGKQAARPAVQRAESGPSWSELSAGQKAALHPLEQAWKAIDGNRKRKWIALSANFGSLSAREQATLHGRMRDWALLSPAERNRARLNFAQSRDLTSEDKKARWEAYQALSPEQRRQLAAEAARPAGAAPAVTQRPAGRLAAVPTTRSERAAVSSPAVKAPAASAGASSP